MTRVAARLMLVVVCLASSAWAEGKTPCPSGCRCSSPPSVHSRHRWHRLLASYRMRRLVYGRTAGVGMDLRSKPAASGRHMTCFGLEDIPEEIPEDVSKVTFYGDSRGASRNSLRDKYPADFGSHETASKPRQLTHVAQYSLAGTAMKTLSIEGNRIKTIHPDDFEMLSQLTRLNLKNNRIKQMRAGALNGLVNLEDVDISRNHLKRLPKTTFYGTEKLHHLSLAQNNVRAVNGKLLKHLRNLEKFDMSDNLLRDLPRDFFRNSEQLREVNVQNNNIRVIHAEWFLHLSNLTKLNLKGNRIHSLPAAIFQPLTALKTLDLERNEIDYISFDMFASIPSLHTLGLASNNISIIEGAPFANLTNLKELQLHGNSLRELYNDTFRGLDNLEKLDLSGNKLLDIPRASIAGLKKLQRLDVSKNNLKIIYKHNFYGLYDIRELRLDHNGIKVIEDEGLAVSPMNQYSKITWLYLNDNRISSITRNSLYGLYYLKFLNLGQNQIETVDDGALTFTNRLNTLILQDNRIAELPVAVFKHLKHLHHLNLASNRLEKLRMNVFLGLVAMEDVNLQDNLLEDITAEPFLDTPRLSALYLRGNSIRGVDMGILELMHRLKYLDLSHNRIMDVRMPEYYYRNLYHLSFADNELKSLPAEARNLMTTGGSLHLYGNPWTCDCRLAWMTGLGEEGGPLRLAMAEDLVCKAPKKLSGELLMSLEQREFVCDGETENEEDYILYDEEELAGDRPASWNTMGCDFSEGIIDSTKRDTIKTEKYLAYDWLVTILDNSRNFLCAGVRLSHDWILSPSECWKNKTRNDHALMALGPAAGYDDLVGVTLRRVLDYPGASQLSLVKSDLGHKEGEPQRHFPCVLSPEGVTVAGERGAHALLLARERDHASYRKIKLRGFPVRSVQEKACGARGAGMCVRGNRVRLADDTWTTDSAPLFVKVGPTRWALAGLAVGGPDGGPPRDGFTYRRVLPLHHVLDWIDRNVELE